MLTLVPTIITTKEKPNGNGNENTKDEILFAKRTGMNGCFIPHLKKVVYPIQIKDTCLLIFFSCEKDALINSDGTNSILGSCNFNLEKNSFHSAKFLDGITNKSFPIQIFIGENEKQKVKNSIDYDQVIESQWNQIPLFSSEESKSLLHQMVLSGCSKHPSVLFDWSSFSSWEFPSPSMPTVFGWTDLSIKPSDFIEWEFCIVGNSYLPTGKLRGIDIKDEEGNVQSLDIGCDKNYYIPVHFSIYDKDCVFPKDILVQIVDALSLSTLSRKKSTLNLPSGDNEKEESSQANDSAEESVSLDYRETRQFCLKKDLDSSTIIFLLERKDGNMLECTIYKSGYLRIEPKVQISITLSGIKNPLSIEKKEANLPFRQGDSVILGLPFFLGKCFCFDHIEKTLVFYDPQNENQGKAEKQE